MRWALAGNQAVGGQRQPLALRPFLERGLGILGRLDLLGKERLPPSLHEAARRRKAAIEEERRDHGLAGIGKQAVAAASTLLGLAARNAQMRAQVDRLGH